MKYKHNAGYRSVPLHYICIFLLPVKNSSILKLKSLKSQQIIITFDHAAHSSSFKEFYLVTKLALPVNINTLRTGDADLRFYITTVQDG